MIDTLARPSSSGSDDSRRITLEPMQLSDISDVMHLEKRCYTLPWSANAYATEIGNPSAQYLIARNAAGEMIGYGGVWVVMDEMHITTLAVDPAVRGRKIGERLLIQLIFEGSKRGAERATLEVRQRNHVAHNLYLKYGFGDVHVRKAYYSDNNENAIIMWAENINALDYRTLLFANLREIEREHGEDVS